MLTSTRFKSTTLRPHNDGPAHYVHEGMYESARWLYDGQNEVSTLTHNSSSTTKSEVNGAGMATALERFAAAGYSITLVGHSLGAGVAVLLGLIMGKRKSDFHNTSTLLGDAKA